MGFSMRVKYGAVGEDSEIPAAALVCSCDPSLTVVAAREVLRFLQREAKLEELNKIYSTKILTSCHTQQRVNEEA